MGVPLAGDGVLGPIAGKPDSYKAVIVSKLDAYKAVIAIKRSAAPQ